MTNCNHIWISNSGNGGEPRFSGTPPRNHVLCKLCNARTWLTVQQWEEQWLNRRAKC